MKVFRFEFDNDTLVGSDDAFTAGWSVQFHSQMLDEWTPGLAGWIGRLPTLDDDGDGGRIVRWAWGITQHIITPQDITATAAQPDDAPWAGLLGGYASWTAYDDRRLAALQMYLGCVGPCSQAEEVHKFVHDDLGFGEPPHGWANQLEEQVLVNLNYEYRHKLWTSRTAHESQRWGSDVSVGTQLGIGSFATYAEAWIEYRFGSGLPRGFTKLADPPAIGIAIDPVYLDPNGPSFVPGKWRTYFNLVARIRAIDEFAPLESSTTENGGHYDPIVATPGEKQVIAGIHVVNVPLAFHVTYYRYLDESMSGLPSNRDWINLSFERRF